MTSNVRECSNSSPGIVDTQGWEQMFLLEEKNTNWSQWIMQRRPYTSVSLQGYASIRGIIIRHGNIAVHAE
jgi:hypothetical protein